MIHRLSELPVREVFPGFHGRFVHAGRSTFAYWDVEEGASVPQHAHPHEQVVNMLEGELELTVDGTAHRLRAGDVLVIPGGSHHSARAIGPCRVLDVFTPVRDDYRFA
jgi:quercetin dioxygenase-like cupin family protein